MPRTPPTFETRREQANSAQTPSLELSDAPSTMHSIIDILPSELILAVIEEFLLTAKDSPPVVATSLITITSISSYWRDIAIKHGPFWANIYVKLFDPPKLRRRATPELPIQVTANDIDRVRCFLERSKQSPIHVFIPRSWIDLDSLADDERISIEEGWRVMNDLLDPHLERCRTVSLQFGETSGSIELPRLSEKRRFGLLTELVLEIYEQVHEPLIWDTTWDVSSQWTPLRTLRFYDHWTYLPKSIDVPWPLLSLIELNVSGQFWPSVCDTLAQLPSLREFVIKLGPIKLGDPPRETKIHLPFVERATTNSPAIWHDIFTPSLRSVTFLTGPALLYNVSSTIATEFFARETTPIFAKLLSLLAEMPIHDATFSGTSIDHHVIRKILQALKQVDRLRLYDTAGHGKLLDRVCQIFAEQRPMETTSATRTSTNPSAELFLPLLNKISIEESRARYWPLEDLSDRFPEPPDWLVCQEPTEIPDELRKKLHCDQCRKRQVN
ncbi:hypothetical protein DL93DRAFT_2164329 [Clavulina sp. PMI_390]|nr:hypothetical protein DL93DRAFT_2164329 [Clavulina sp. PMI_390]